MANPWDADEVVAPAPWAQDEIVSTVKPVPSHKRGEDVREITLGGMALGGLEGAGALASGAVAYPAGLAVSAIDLARGKGMAAARKDRALVQGGLTYEPRTDEGKGFVGAVGRLMAPWTKSAEYVGKKVGEATGMPTLGGMAEEGFGAVVNPLALGALSRGLKGQKVLVDPRVKLNPAARTLGANGVRDLTAGQIADPNSLPAILERVSADQPFGLRPQRDAAKESFMRAAQDKGTAPGAKPPTNPDIQSRLGELFDQYGPVYGPLKAVPVAPDVLDGLRSAANMPKRGIDARTIAGAKAEIENALSVLGPEFMPATPAHAHGHGAPPAGPQPLPLGTILGPNGQPLPPPAPPPLKATVGGLLKARENVRTAIRSSGDDFDRLRLLQTAEEEFTQAIDSALPAPQQATLRAADRQYARLMQAATAAPRGRTDFTPGQYLRRVEKSSGSRNFKKGEAGDLQDLGEAARDVFAEAPMTGFRPGVLSAMPGAKYWGAPVSRVLNSPSGRRFLFDPRTRLELTGSPEAAPASLAAAMARAMEARNEALPPRLRLQLAAAHEQEAP